MLTATKQVIQNITDKLPVTYAYTSEILDDGQTFQLHACSGFDHYSKIKEGQKINGYQAAAMAMISHDEVVFNEDDYKERDLFSQFTYGLQTKSGVSVPIAGNDGQWGVLAVYSDLKRGFNKQDIDFIRSMANVIALNVQKPQTSNLPVAKENDVEKKHFFLQFAIPVALSYWLLDSFIHYFFYGELEFEIIPSDINELWMRSSIFILLVAFGLFADYQSKKSIDKSITKSQAESITRAKKQWELAVDSLPQLVITMDHNAKIIRVNRTIETWGIGKVNQVNGLRISDLLKSFTDGQPNDSLVSNWTYIWKKIKNKEMLEWKIKNDIGKTYQYTLRKTANYDRDKDQCYAVLVIDDVTTRQDVEKSLKKHALELGKKINEQTLELKQANEQLEYELQVQKRAKKKLKEAQECRLGLLHQLFATQENERKRIAYELHDSIGQSLGATKFKVEELLINKQNNFNEIEYSQFNDVVEKIKNVIHEVRNIAMDLRPAMLDDLGTIVTLNWFCREFQNTYTGITIEQLLNVEESDIAEERKIVIFRIVQEAMNNVVKHANATNITLELSNSDSGLTLCISDNGCGFDMNLLCNKNIKQFNKNLNTPKCSLGLSSMRERAETTNGKFLIESTPGDGTSVMVSWKI